MTAIGPSCGGAASSRSGTPLGRAKSGRTPCGPAGLDARAALSGLGKESPTDPDAGHRDEPGDPQRTHKPLSDGRRTASWSTKTPLHAGP